MGHTSNHIKSPTSSIIVAKNGSLRMQKARFLSTKVPIETCSGGKHHEASSQALLGRPEAQGFFARPICGVHRYLQKIRDLRHTFKLLVGLLSFVIMCSYSVDEETPKKNTTTPADHSHFDHGRAWPKLQWSQRYRELHCQASTPVGSMKYEDNPNMPYEWKFWWDMSRNLGGCSFATSDCSIHISRFSWDSVAIPLESHGLFQHSWDFNYAHTISKPYMSTFRGKLTHMPAQQLGWHRNHSWLNMLGSICLH